MDKSTIVSELESGHAALIDLINTLSETEFTSSQTDRWTAGQDLEHIRLSVKPLAGGLARTPKFMISKMFGKATNPSLSFDEVVAKYKANLSAGGVATGKYIPKIVSFKKRDKLTGELRNHISGLCKSINKFSEKDLDELRLPHPLLGKLTIREMLYFTIYHVGHHTQIIKNNTRQLKQS